MLAARTVCFYGVCFLSGWADDHPDLLALDARLGADHLARREAELSPGERSRAGLAVLVARGTNLLLLDEPTNHLDLDAIEELERALSGYDGTLVVVSHDRRLLANLRLDRRLEVVEGRVAEAPLPVAAPG